MFEEESVISDESSRVKAVLDDALQKNDVAVDGLLRQYATSTHGTSSQSPSSAHRSHLTFIVPHFFAKVICRNAWPPIAVVHAGAYRMSIYDGRCCRLWLSESAL